MTAIEMLTAVEAANLCQDAGGVGGKALRVIAALTAENERLRARIDSEFTHDQLLHEVSSYRNGMMAAESSLAAATELLIECQPWMPSSRTCDASRNLDAFLAKQPAAPISYDLALREWQGGAPGAARPGQPAAPVYATAAQSASELMARVHAPLPGWDNIERKTAAPARTVERLPPRHIPEDQLVPIDAPTRTEARLDSAIAAVKSYREVVARTEAEQAVLDAFEKVPHLSLENSAESPGPIGAACRAELARRGVK